MTDTPTLGEVVAQQLQRHRKALGLTQQEVADRTAAVGHPVSRATLAKLEVAGATRTENVSLKDVLALAAALDTSPLTLFLPLGETERVAITPGLTVHPQVALEWVTGEDDLRDAVPWSGHTEAWHRNVQRLFLFRRLRELQDAARRDDTDEAFARLAEHLTYMERAGLSVPEMPEAWRGRLGRA